MMWQEVIQHPSLQYLPFKIELHGKGIIEMSPATNWHGFYQTEIATLLNQQLTHGRCISEASIQTSNGIRVVSVIWATREFLQANFEQTPFLTAPTTCVGVISPSNIRKEMRQKNK
jgi:Uma2 family endonuclease